QWNLRESQVVDVDLNHHNQVLGKDGLSVIPPRETTTNYVRRGTTLGVSERRVIGGTVLETTLQWTHRQDSDLAKGTELLEVRPQLWTGNYFTDRRGNLQRWHGA